MGLEAFTVGDVLGRGAAGIVRAAVHRDTGVALAIKSLLAAPTAGVHRAFRREATMIARLDHPAVVPVLDFGWVPEDHPVLSPARPYLVMPRARGTLVDHLGQASWPELHGVLLTLLEGLAHAHARGVLHGDVKPSNVLVGVRRDPRQPLAAPLDGLALSDFGIARQIGRSGPRGGTPGFVAPEQIADDSALVGPWTDLYGLGALGWALATGGPPPEIGDGARFVSRHPVPPDLEDWLRWLLAAAPEGRPARAVEAIEVLPGRGGAPASLRGAARSDEAAPAAEAPTTRAEFDPISTLAPGPPRPRSAPSPTRIPRIARIPVPPSWRPRRPAWPSPTLRGAGLGLWGLRQPGLVGREAVRDALWAALRDVADNERPRIRYVVGPSGAGRTRTLDWIRQLAQERAGAAGVVSSTSSLPELTSTLTVCTIDDRDEDEALAKRLAAVARLGDPASVAKRRSARRPIDEPVEGLRAPWLFVVALRSPPSWEIPPSDSIALEDLHPADLEQLARESLPLAPEVVQWLAREAAGRPGRVVDQLGYWIAHGALIPTSRGFVVDEGAPGRDGSTVEIGERGLEIAAVFGERFPDDLVPDDTVERGERRGWLVREVGPRPQGSEGRSRATSPVYGWRFARDGVRRALLAQAGERRPDLHLRCADWWARRPERTAAEAWHRVRGGKPRAAAHVGVAAARRAVRRGRLREAGEAIAAADRGLTELTGEERLRAEVDALRLHLDGATFEAGGRAALAASLCERAEAAGWPDLLAEARARQAVDCSNRGRPHEARPLAAAAIRLADEHGPDRVRVLARWYLLQIAILLGDAVGAAKTLGELEALDGSDLARVVAHLGRSLLARSESPEEAMRHARRAHDEAVRTGLDLERANALRALGAACRRAGAWAEEASTWRSYLDLARDLGLDADLPNVYADLGAALRRAGDAPESERMLQRAVAWMRYADQSDVAPRLNLARLYLEQQRYGEARTLLEPVDVDDIGWPSLVPQVLALRLAIAARWDEPERARDAVAGLEATDPAILHGDPEIRELLALALAACASAGLGAEADRLTTLTGGR